VLKEGVATQMGERDEVLATLAPRRPAEVAALSRPPRREARA